ncbi:hypothetical protein NDU88_001972 [Pleurodeles waltl]|uniref:Secreted protein n=1 Tax=Pleurodeles waltl TaxID=8319 RepID=A0AAV7LZ68_PLEWA|nr:hypothetical protein NDU88_001972 [Pleurodeles waltl]
MRPFGNRMAIAVVLWFASRRSQASTLPERSPIKPCVCDNRNNLGWILLHVYVVIVGVIVWGTQRVPQRAFLPAIGSGATGESPVGASMQERLLRWSGRHLGFRGTGYECRVRSDTSSLVPVGTNGLSLIDP